MPRADEGYTIRNGGQTFDDLRTILEFALQMLKRPTSNSPVNGLTIAGDGQAPRTADCCRLATQLDSIEKGVDLIWDEVELLEEFKQTAETIFTWHGLNQIPKSPTNENSPIPSNNLAADTSTKDWVTSSAIPIATTDQHQPGVRPYHISTAIIDHLVTQVNRLIDQLNNMSAHLGRLSSQVNDISNRQANLVDRIDHLKASSGDISADVSAQIQRLSAEYRTLVNQLRNKQGGDLIAERKIPADVFEGQEIGDQDREQKCQHDNQDELQADSPSTPPRQDLSSTMHTPVTPTTVAVPSSQLPRPLALPRTPVSTPSDTERKDSDYIRFTVATKSPGTVQPSSPASIFNPRATEFKPITSPEARSSQPEQDLIAAIPRKHIAQAMTTAFFTATKDIKFKSLQDSIHAPKPGTGRGLALIDSTPTLTEEQLVQQLQQFHERSEKRGIKITAPASEGRASGLTNAQIEEAAYSSLDIFERTFASPKMGDVNELPALEEEKGPALEVEKPEQDEQKWGEPEQETPEQVAPKYEQPEYEKSEYENSKYEEPEYEEPEYEEPEYEEPEYEEPEQEEPEPEAPVQEKPGKLATKLDLTGGFLKAFQARYSKPKSCESDEPGFANPAPKVANTDMSDTHSTTSSATNIGDSDVFDKPSVTISATKIGDVAVFEMLTRLPPVSIPPLREGWKWEEAAGPNGRLCWRLRNA